MSRPPQPPGQPPVSFRTVPGRNRTQKWNQAKTYNYDGDDWGGYDPYEEYGGPSDGRSLPPPPGQSAFAQNSRSNRANSFDPGEERRAFSAGQPATYEEDRNGSMTASSRRPNEHGRPRDFTNPEQVPRPLNTRVSPNRAGPASATAADTVQQSESSAPAVMEKPLPFIRPSDIYKRMNEEKERERQSLDSSRPSMDSVQRGDSSSPALGSNNGNDSDSAAIPLRMKPSLEPVAEKRESLIEPVRSAMPAEPNSSELQQTPSLNTLPTTSSPAEATVQTLRPVLPPVSHFSGLGSVDDYMGGQSSGPKQSSGDAETTASRVLDAPVEAQSGMGLSHDGQHVRSFAPPGKDPATEFLADRQREAAADSSDNRAPTDLQHQPSMGYKSVVNTAFDRSDDTSIPPTPSSRNESQATNTSGVIRSDTNSTTGISPIMSHVPSDVPTQHRGHEREMQIPPVIEEPPQSHPPALLPSTTYQTSQASTPGHSRNASGETPANVQPGYRRSLDPPSNGSSPARTPGLEDTSTRRLSTPMAAETVDALEPAGVSDQAAEIPNARLEPMDARVTEDEEARQEAVDDYSKALPTGRGRSGTNYSLREADLARTINASPDDASYSPAAAEAERATREQFLREHASNPATPSSASFGPKSPGANAAGLGIVRTATPNSAKGRVREIADKYHEIHEAARRDSETSVVSTKSSWSNFRGSEENLHAPLGGRSLRRTNTGSQLALSTSPEREHDEAVLDSPDKMFPEYDNSGDRTLKGADALNESSSNENRKSFRPSMPGEWISAAPTPSGEEPPEISSTAEHSHDDRGYGEPTTPRASHIPTDEPGEGIDLTPTTRKEPLQTSKDFHSETPSSEFSSFGPASSSSAAPDFSVNPSSSSAIKNVHADQARNAGTALGAHLMSNAGLTSQSRDFAVREVAPVRQPEMEPHPAIGDVYGSSKLHIPPPLERGDSFATEGTASTASMSPQKESPVDGQENRKPGDAYFQNSGPPEPLAPLAFRKGSRPDGSTDEIARTGPSERPTMVQSAFSADSVNVGENTGDSESDRLRREIVRSLDPIQSDHSDQAKNSAERNITSGEAGSSLGDGPSHTLNRKFSWERTDDEPLPAPTPAVTSVPVPRIAEPEPEPEVAPEMPYERPRSRGLHIVNPGENDSPVSPVNQQGSKDKALPPLVSPISRTVSPLNDSQNALSPGASKQKQDDMAEVAPSPMSERHGSDADSFDHRLPSYYFSGSDVLGLGAAGAAGAAAATAAVVVGSESAKNTEAISRTGESTENPLPATPSPIEKVATTPKATGSHGGPESPRIPPFREILAVKSAPERIEAYTTTRQTFATMETGLDNWLRGMLAQHPEHADLTSVPQGGYKPITPLQSSSTFRMGHRKASPSLARLTSLATGVGGNGERKVSGAGDEAAESSSPGGAVGAELQQRSKDLLKNAGVLGGKAQAGAKGLFAKGKSRFGRKDGDAKATTTPAPAPLSSQQRNSMYTDVRQQPLDGTTVSRHTTDGPQANTTGHLSYEKSFQSTGTQSSAVDSTTTLPATASGLSLPINTRIHRLSNTFSRLRTRSRSASTSRSSNRSRPTSMLLTSLNPMFDLESNHGHESATESKNSSFKGLQLDGLNMSHDSNGTGCLGASQVIDDQDEYRTPTSATTNRREAWQTSNAVPKTPWSNDGSADPTFRLGVLPSPGRDSSSFTEEFSSRQKSYPGVEDLAADEDIAKSSANLDIRSASHLDRSAEGQIKDVSSDAYNRHETVNLSKVENMPYKYEQPAQERNSNGRSSLPSQRRLSTQGPPTPTNTLGFWRRSIGNADALNENEPTGLASEAPPHAQAAASEASSTRPQLGPHNRAAHEHEGDVTSLGHAIDSAKDNAERPTSLAIASDDRKYDGLSAMPKSENWDYESDISEESLLESKSTHLTLGLGFEKDVQTRGKSDLDSRHSSVSSLDHPIGDYEKRSMFQKQQHEGSQLPPQTLVSVPLAVPHAPQCAPPANVFQNNNELAGIEKHDIAAAALPLQSSFASHTTPSNFRNFMARSYHGPVPSEERPMSYLPLPRDSSGYPIAETIDTVQAGQPASPIVDLSVFSGPPPGTPPFLQHPAFRQPSPNISQSEFDKKTSVQGVSKTNDSVVTSKEVAVKEKAPPVQLSALARVPDGPVERKEGVARKQTPPIAPAGADVLQSEREPAPVPRVLQRDAQPGKRTSGLWDSFKRSSMAFKDDTGNDDPQQSGSRKDSAAGKVRESTTAPNTLKKKHSQPAPQRAVSAAVPPTEPKKKRFSGISSLFNRSNTTVAKPVKLTKPEQREKDNARKGYGGPNKSNNASVTGMISGYESYEAMRRQQIRDFSASRTAIESQLPQLNKDLPPPPPRASSMPLQTADPAKSTSELNNSARRYSEIPSSTKDKSGSHGHIAGQYSKPSRPTNAKSHSPPPFSGLDADATRRGSLEIVIPEAFRPTEASYGERVKAVGPPPNGSTAQAYVNIARDKQTTPPLAHWNHEDFGTAHNDMQTPPHQMSHQAAGPVSPPTPYDHSQPRQSISPVRPARVSQGHARTGNEGVAVVDYAGNRQFQQQSTNMQSHNLPNDKQQPSQSDKHRSWYMQKEAVPNLPPPTYYTSSAQTQVNVYGSHHASHQGGRHSMPPQISTYHQATARSRSIPWESNAPPMPYAHPQPPAPPQYYQQQNAGRYYASDAQQGIRPQNNEHDAPMSLSDHNERITNEGAVMRGSSYPGQEWVPPQGRDDMWS